mgnify:CR=1 FL=1
MLPEGAEGAALGAAAGAPRRPGGAPPAVQAAFNAMRLIVSVGWSIYPLGYYFGYLQGAVSAQLLNLIYNLADFVNKIAFVLVIWNAACGERDAANAE